MIRIESVNFAISRRARAEEELVGYLEEHARRSGLITARLPVVGQADDLLITCERDPRLPWLLFECHLDTVGIEAMDGEPLAGHVTGGRIFGRGACDAKGSGAAMLWALRRYAAAPEGPNNIALLYTVDEEISRTGIRAFIHEHLPALPWRPGGAVVGEPSTLRLVTAHKGDVRLTVRTEGVAAHSSDPSRGRSAIRMMRSVLEVLEDRYIPSITATHPLTGPAVGSVNIIRGGSQVNVIPRYCEIEIDRRIVPGEDPAVVLSEIERLIAELRRDDPDLRISVHDPAIHAPLDPAGGEGFARRVAERLEAIGRSGEPIGVGYGSDAGDLAEADIPTVVLGPGDITHAHGPDEWLELEELDGAVAAYGSIMGMGAAWRTDADRAS